MFNVSKHENSEKRIEGLARNEYQINRNQQRLLTFLKKKKIIV